MFDLEAQIKAWRAELARAGIRDQKVVDELEFHVRQHFAELIRSGLPEEAAFQSSTKRLGDGEVLQKEFLKVKRYGSRNWSNNPLALNLVCAWLVLMGSDSISQLVGLRLAAGAWWQPFWGREQLLEMTFCWFVSLQILTGIGVLWRGRFSRYFALVFLSIDSGSVIWGLIQHFKYGWDRFGTNFYSFLGIHISMRFEWATDVLILGFSLFGLYTLVRPSVRQLFRPGMPRGGLSA